MIPFGAVLAIFGLGIMLPNEIGGIVIGALPLALGLYIFSKGAGIESTVNRVIQEMRENADAAMFSSLLWTATLFSAIFAVAEGVASVWLGRRHSRFSIRAVVERDSLFPRLDGDRVLDLDRRVHALAPQTGFVFRKSHRAERLWYGGVFLPQRCP